MTSAVFSESLKQEECLYLARVEPYNGDQPFELLVERAESYHVREVVNTIRTYGQRCIEFEEGPKGDGR